MQQDIFLDAVEPSRGIGIDFSENMIAIARERYPYLEFRVDDVERLSLKGEFDYILMANVVGDLVDVQQAFQQLKKVTTPETRLVIANYNYLWEPIVKLAEKLRLKIKQPVQNWLSFSDIESLLHLAGYEVIRRYRLLLLPKYVPLLSWFLNRIIAPLPLINKLCFVQVVTAKEVVHRNNYDEYTCSVIVPCRNERGNVESAVLRTPPMGKHTELIFVDGNSMDGTAQEIERMIALHPERDITLIHQGSGRGKGDAVRKGFAAAYCDVLMILDADLTVPPEELPKFYNALVEGKGEFINGSRLVYPMEKQAMRFLNTFGNKFFSIAFTYLLEQRFKDTLCGTKCLFRRDYQKIVENRAFFGDFDPFGDFDLIFGAAKQNLKTVEIPIHYRERMYGATNISRFTHGWLLLKMCLIAARKLKFI